MNIRYWIISTCKIILLTIIFSTNSLSQIQWELPLYFSDAAGNLDTIVIGIAENATSGTDTTLGEFEINDQLWDETFEVRVIFGGSPGGDHDLWDNPQYKKMYLEGEGDFGNTSFAVAPFRIVVRTINLPITFHYNSDLIGYPSLVNLIVDPTSIPRTLQDWTIQVFPDDHPANPSFQCMMHTDSLVEDFRFHRFMDSVGGVGNAVYGTTIFIENGDTVFTPGFNLYNFTSWSENYYCDRIVGTQTIYQPKENLFIQNPVQNYLQLRSSAGFINEWAIYNLSGLLMLEGDLFYSDQIDVTDFSPGIYIFRTRNNHGQIVVARFIMT